MPRDRESHIEVEGCQPIAHFVEVTKKSDKVRRKKFQTLQNYCRNERKKDCRWFEGIKSIDCSHLHAHTSD